MLAQGADHAMNYRDSDLRKEIQAIVGSNGVDVVLDPVGAGATAYRNAALEELLAIGSPAIIRGNASEIMSVAGLNAATKGVESLAASDASKLLGFASYHEIPDDPVVVEAENDAVGNRIYHPPVLRRKNVIEPALSQILEGVVRKEARQG